MYDIVILTDRRYVKPKTRNWYVNQVLLEDKILQNELENLGLRVCRQNWNNKNFDWLSCRYAIFRTTWDYFEKFKEFFCWIEKTQLKTKFINSVEIINWNIDKHYLKDLAINGINITPTIFLKKSQKITLKELFEKTQWIEAVIKPAISGAARHTYRINSENCYEYEDIFQSLINNESILFQEFMNSITITGEISLIMIGGQYTHAVKKNAKKNDFRVQDDHGGKVTEYNATYEEILFAKKCLKSAPFTPIYARVDIVYDNKNQPCLIELELIEPELWFRYNPKSAHLLAKEIFNLTTLK